MTTERQDGGGFLLPAGTTALLLADLEGSTRLFENDAAEASSAMARLDEIVAETVGRHNGVRPLEQGEGDSFVAAFARPSDAVACALAIQRGLLPAGLRLRMAVHTGEVQIRDERNYVGITINRCARVRDAAHGGQILVTSATAELVADRLPPGASLRDLGLHRFRDLSRAERVFQLRHPDVPPDFPHLRSLDARPHNLPVQLTRFVGRAADIGAVRRLLSETRLLTVVGTGGAGKTRLALQVGAEVIDDVPGGAWFVDLADVTEPDRIPGAVREAIGLRDDPSRKAIDVIASAFTDRAVLVILDNCEQVAAGCATAAEALLRACPALSILATSREPLGSAGETVWQIPNLTLPAEDDPPRIGAVAVSEAVDLFVDRARKARTNFGLTEDNAAAVARICTRLDGIPLAIELAAARVRTLPVERIAAGLDDRFRLLGVGPRTAVPRHQTLRASIDWSYGLLSEEERTVFRRLAVFAGGFELDAAEHVCSLEDVDRYVVLDLVTALVDRSLVEVDEGGRYRLLETVRQYARERLDDAGEHPAVAARHCDWFVQWSQRVLPALRGPDERDWLSRLVTEADNLRSALHAARTTRLVEDAAWLILAMHAIFELHGSAREVGALLAECLAEADALPEPLRIDLLVEACDAGFRSGEHQHAVAAGREAFERALAIGDDARAGDAAIHFAWAVAYVEGVEAGIATVDDCFTKTDGDTWSCAWRLILLGHLHALGGQLDESARQNAEGGRLAAAHGHARPLRHARKNEAGLLFRAGDLVAARDAFAAVSSEAREAGDRQTQYEAAVVVAQLCIYLGELDTARSALDEARRGFELVGEGFWGIGYYEGLLALAEDRPRDAANAFLTFDLSGVGPAIVIAQLVLALIEAGDLERARGYADEAWRADHGGVSQAVGAAFAARGFLRAAEGDLAGAEDDFHEVLRLHMEHGQRHWLANSFVYLASFAVTAGSFEEAARLLGAIGRLETDTGAVLFPCFERPRASTVDACLKALGGDRYEATFAEGFAMDWREAIAYARRGRGERKRPSHGWASLTPMETEVVALVAQGLTNPQIAEKIFVSSRTVQSHLRNVFAKLGVATRAELAAEAAHRAGSQR